ncbi:MAG TPA: ABC transporter permease [Prolixibacteraceae bacterium]|nr:ABC transporter permease [Prolixibacteraceae bacterium]HPR84701.1 ABC transporter permease [Prolixibacteraceae bacterium]
MNVNLYIARRIFSDKENRKSLSHRIVNIALLGIILGLVVLILSVAIVTGYKTEVGKKVIGFGSHLQIVNLDSNESYETSPVSQNQPFLPELKSIDGVRHVQVFATKPGIIKAGTEIQGVVLKGIGPDFDWSFFLENKISGEPFTVQDTAKTNKVWISKQMADLLGAKIGDKLSMFFVNPSDVVPRQRKFELAGIYKTSLEEFDRLFVLADINHVRKLNNWSENEVSGFEVLVNDFRNLDQAEKKVSNLILRHTRPDSPVLQVVSIKEKYRQIFDWLGLLDMNVWIILVLMVLVAGFNMVSSLLVIILERTQMIGILKAMGARNWSVRKVFLYFSGMLILKALIWGNVVGVGICLLQYYTHFFKLDAASYYLAYVPVNLSIVHLLLLNIGTVIVTIAMLVLPSYFITKISPEKIIRFE